jgi:hypothetical protein
MFLTAKKFMYRLEKDFEDLMRSSTSTYVTNSSALSHEKTETIAVSVNSFSLQLDMKCQFTNELLANTKL